MQGELLQTMALTLVYGETPIGRRAEMLSLTDMWKAAGSPDGRAPSDWLALVTTREFVAAVEAGFNAGISGIETQRGGSGAGRGGTWGHWQIGLAYAKYLSPEFHIWCNTVVREVMDGRSHKPIQRRQLASTFGAYFEIARLIGLDQNQAALSAGRATKGAVGENPLEALGVTHLLAPQQNALLTVTDIGKRLDGKSAIAVNQMLQERGFQIGLRDLKDNPYWEPTTAGREHAVFLDTGKKHSDGTPIRQLKWTASVVDLLAVEPEASQPGAPA